MKEIQEVKYSNGKESTGSPPIAPAVEERKAVNMADGCSVQGRNLLVRVHRSSRNQLGYGCSGKSFFFDGRPVY